MRVCILGAKGRIGRHATAALLAAGHDVVAVSRTPMPGAPATVIVGEARDASVLDRAVAGAGAVIAALGPHGNRTEEADALEEAMQVIRLMWSGQRGARFAGRYYSLKGAHTGPVPDRFESNPPFHFAADRSFGSTRRHDASGSNAVIRDAMRAVFGPRSFCSTTPA